MNHDFADITSRIREAPTWWDSNGTPRYGTFEPRACPNIYAEECALLEIECQSCGRLFMVEDNYSQAAGALHGHQSLSAQMPRLHWGDPPYHQISEMETVYSIGITTRACVAGVTMNSIPRRVLEFWIKDRFCNWQRHVELEVPLVCDWAEERSAS